MNARTFSMLAWLIVGPIGLTAVPTALVGSKVYVGAPCRQPNRPSLDEVDHSDFDRLLRTYVDGRGMVAYARWKANPNDLRARYAYLARLSCVDLSKPASTQTRLAYWINAYNAVTLQGILREYPTSSIRDHTSKLGYNLWDDLILLADNREVSLNQI